MSELNVRVIHRSISTDSELDKLQAQAESRGTGAAGHPCTGGAAGQHPSEAAGGGGGGGQEAEGGEQGEADRRPHVQRR